jgi:hypothetical protein
MWFGDDRCLPLPIQKLINEKYFSIYYHFASIIRSAITL